MAGILGKVVNFGANTMQAAGESATNGSGKGKGVESTYDKSSEHILSKINRDMETALSSKVRGRVICYRLGGCLLFFFLFFETEPLRTDARSRASSRACPVGRAVPTWRREIPLDRASSERGERSRVFHAPRSEKKKKRRKVTSTCW